MLYFIRERAVGWVAYLIVFLISIPFALWGISEYLGFGGGPEAAEVDGVAIPLTVFTEAYQRNRSSLERPASVSAEDWRDLLRERVLEELIAQELRRQFLDRSRLQVTDREVAESIEAMEVFRAEGRFDAARYRNILKANLLEPTRFEADQRLQLRTELLRSFLEDSATVGAGEARRYRRLRDETRELRYFEVPRSRFAEPEAVTGEQVEARYAAAAGRYRSRARAKLSYLELRLEDLAADAEPLGEAALAAYHEAHALDFMTPELRRLRQIFLRAGDGAAERAADLHQQLLDGADFAELAREHSEDELSARRGGAVGQVAEADLPEDLGPLVFSLEPGRPGAPVTTERGIYLLEVEAAEPARLRGLDEVREQVAEQAARAELERRYGRAAEELSLAAYENPESLAAAVERLGRPARKTEWVYLSAPPEGVLSRPEVAEALRREEVLEGMNSDRIDLEDGWSVVVRVDEHVPAAARPLDEVRDGIRAELVAEAAQAKLLEYAVEAARRLREGADFAALAAEQEAEVRAPGAVGRNAPDLPAAALERAFSLRPGADGPGYGVAVLPDGVALLALDAVHRAEEDAAAEADAADLERLRRWRRTEEEAALRAQLAAAAEIVRYPERLQ